MQSLNQGCQPIRMRARWSQLSASGLRLENVRKCSLGLPRDSGSNWSLFGRSGTWSFRRTMLCPFSRGVALAHLKWNQWYWLLTKQDSSFFWWTNTFKNHDLHEKTVEGKTNSCNWSTYCFPHGLKYVSTNVNIMSLHIIKLLQICSFVSPNLHICADYKNGNKKYAHSAYIAPYIPFLPLFHLCNTSFSFTIFFSRPLLFIVFSMLAIMLSSFHSLLPNVDFLVIPSKSFLLIHSYD